MVDFLLIMRIIMEEAVEGGCKGVHYRLQLMVTEGLSLVEAMVVVVVAAVVVVVQVVCILVVLIITVVVQGAEVVTTVVVLDAMVVVPTTLIKTEAVVEVAHT